MAPHRPPAEATPPPSYTGPRVPLQTQATLLPPRNHPLCIWTTSESSSLGPRLTLPFLEAWNPHPRGPVRDTRKAIVNSPCQASNSTVGSNLHYLQPPIMAPLDGLILLGDSEKKVLLDSGGGERETARRLAPFPLSSVLIPSGWSPRRCGLLTFVF